MPCYEFRCSDCEFEWEDICSFKDPLPAVCPECQTEGKVIKLISLPSNGVVELTGHDLKSKLKSDARKIQQKASRDENTLANLVGPKYEENLALKKKLSDTRPKIKKSRKKSA